jgi:hypothetical protein
MAAYSTDAHLGQQCEILIIDVRNADESIGNCVVTLLVIMAFSFTFSVCMTSEWSKICRNIIDK